MTFPNSWDVHEWQLIFPPMSICPGFERLEPAQTSGHHDANDYGGDVLFGHVQQQFGQSPIRIVTRDSERFLNLKGGANEPMPARVTTKDPDRYVPGIIESVQCDFVTVSYNEKGEKYLKKEPISVKPTTHNIDVTDASMEFECFDINHDLEKAPVLRYSHIANFVSCNMNSSTYVKFTPYAHGSTPLGNWTQWTNLRDDTATNLALQKVEVKFVSGDVTMPYFEVIRIQEELSWQSVSESTRRTMFTVSFPQITTKRYQQYYQEDLLQMIGIVGGIGFIFMLLYRTLLWLFVDIFGVDDNVPLATDANLYDDYEDDSEQEAIASPMSYQKSEYEDITIDQSTAVEAPSAAASNAKEDDDLNVSQDLTSTGYGALE
eukprot:CAMPEP_0117449726 /NCGR_PEP_ID=MMETSP0759-20121206/8093_1 /TAXON_ID=63605 /ORGANISM="Percolomonas cosmopolitus, Strain WS" /LENGTH=375 /DNA_ID=CAMNT_0005242209 /DNA_START=244 /DNA_END=1371 /DNA_ORIENTATION=+